MNSPGSFLQNIIDSYYINYLDMPILLSVYDLNLKLKFTTRFVQKFYNIAHFYEIEKGVMPDNLNIVSEEMALRIEKRMQLMKHSITSNSITRIIHFDQLGQNCGALHTSYTPIVNSNQEACGIVTQSYDYTAEFFGSKAFDSGDYQPELENLTFRQKNILCMWAHNLTQEQIANLLCITRGTVSKVIERIAKKFEVTSSAKKVMFQKINRHYLLENLKFPKVNVPPCLISITKDKMLYSN